MVRLLFLTVFAQIMLLLLKKSTWGSYLNAGVFLLAPTAFFLGILAPPPSGGIPTAIWLIFLFSVQFCSVLVKNPSAQAEESSVFTSVFAVGGALALSSDSLGVLVASLPLLVMSSLLAPRFFNKTLRKSDLKPALDVGSTVLFLLLLVLGVSVQVSGTISLSEALGSVVNPSKTMTLYAIYSVFGVILLIPQIPFLRHSFAESKNWRAWAIFKMGFALLGFLLWVKVVSYTPEWALEEARNILILFLALSLVLSVYSMIISRDFLTALSGLTLQGLVVAQIFLLKGLGEFSQQVMFQAIAFSFQVSISIFILAQSHVSTGLTLVEAGAAMRRIGARARIPWLLSLVLCTPLATLAGINSAILWPDRFEQLPSLLVGAVCAAILGVGTTMTVGQIFLSPAKIEEESEEATLIRWSIPWVYAGVLLVVGIYPAALYKYLTILLEKNSF